MEEKGVIVTVLIVAAVLALMNIGILMNQSNFDVDEVAIAEKSAALVVLNMPKALTMEEINAGLNIPEIIMPEFEVPKALDNQKLDDVWDILNEEDIEALENMAIEACTEEFLEDNEMDGDEFEEGSIYDLFELEDAVVEFKKEYNDREVNVLNLGLDEEDDRLVKITSEIKVEVEPDLEDEFKAKVYVVCDVTSDDGDLEAELVYSLI